MAARRRGRPCGKMGSTKTASGGAVVRFLVGAAVGYVLGTKAGRGRYEQIVRAYRRIADHPAVQGAAGIARAKIEDLRR